MTEEGIWKWENDSSWTNFDQTTSKLIEDAFQKKSSTTSVYINSVKYIINFGDMTQKNTSTNNSRKIKRIEKKEIEENNNSENSIDNIDLIKTYNQTLSKEISIFFNNEKESDIVFSVGDIAKKEKPKKYYGHKLIISARS
jgi:hypothetical protein